MKAKEPKVFVIKHKETKKLWTTPTGKSSWRSTSAAKNAFRYHQPRYPDEPVLFDEQDNYELVELNNESVEERLTHAEKLLKTASETLDAFNYYSDPVVYEVISKIDEFLGE